MITIIIPIYNGEKHLQRCLDSISHQTYKDFEAIIVDDGSTDGTADICDNMARIDSRFRVIHQDNAGVSAARNVALEQAKGDVTFIDADDYVEPDYIEKLKKGLDHPEVDISYCAHREEDEEYNTIAVRGKKQDAIIASCDYNWSNESHGEVWATLFRKEVVKEVTFDKRFFVGEDNLFFLQCLKKARKLYYVHQPLYHYVLYQESAYHGAFSLKKITGVYVWEEICKLSQNSQELNMLKALWAGRIKSFCTKYYSDPAFLESGCSDELIKKYHDIQVIYFKELIRTRKYRELFLGIAFGICPKLFLKLREKKKSLLSK